MATTTRRNKNNCMGCEKSLKEQGQCSRCSRCLNCCDDDKVVRSCAWKYSAKPIGNRIASDKAFSRWQSNPNILKNNRRIS